MSRSVPPRSTHIVGLPAADSDVFDEDVGPVDVRTVNMSGSRRFETLARARTWNDKQGPRRKKTVAFVLTTGHPIKILNWPDAGKVGPKLSRRR